MLCSSHKETKRESERVVRKKREQEREKVKERGIYSYFFLFCHRWLFIRVEAIGASLSLFLGVYFVWQRNSVDAGLAALVLTLAASLLEYAYWMLRQATALDQQLHAFHQITSVIHHTPQHDPREQDNRTTMSAPAQVQKIKIKRKKGKKNKKES